MIDALLQFWQQIQARPDFVPFMCIPLVASIVTWLHVWMALKMVSVLLSDGVQPPEHAVFLLVTAGSRL